MPIKFGVRVAEVFMIVIVCKIHVDGVASEITPDNATDIVFTVIFVATI
jgi:hypothetical protein